jgi:hypothetical protein
MEPQHFVDERARVPGWVVADAAPRIGMLRGFDQRPAQSGGGGFVAGQEEAKYVSPKVCLGE